ncbi:Glycosyltransferase involved in cell wall bisynthesis [Neorhodopirellula lusitana]|uniref:Glycosyltransferase involved in cell wall bisynthesis n=1 Tax=Neorhodopirellula lusitana TaxID=445327 RepID=A0ABY1QMY8_9BACT|nr:glycosyltransferase family 4 protein [Neorhodopirellula lusitana]SMP75483.1 Glycosyltransferase involved in cell wall bisynthesis [Neorhodopirellula lusitana]
MKIGIVGHVKFPIAKPFSGGLETFTHGYVKALVERGHDVTLFASGDSDRSLPLSPIVRRATIPDSRRRLGRVHNGWIESTEDEAYDTLMAKLAGSDYDVIHNHSLSPIPLRFANLLSVPMVTTLHAPVLPRMEAEIKSNGRCGMFVNISNANAAHWSRVLSEQAVIHNGVDVDFWRGCSPVKQNRAVWFGRILADKGPHFAIEAAHKAGLPIDIVGPISDQAYFDNEVAPRLRSDDRYLGHQTHDELCGIISRSSVALVTPCWDEPFGLVVAEALACGTPVAGFKRGALPEIVIPSVGRLATPGDTTALARAVRQCLRLNGEVCRRVAQENFSFERMVSQYEDVYARVATRIAA